MNSPQLCLVFLQMKASVSVAMMAALALVVALPEARADMKQAALDTLGLTDEEYSAILKERQGFADAPKMVSRGEECP